jgi:hypothetical protein
MVFRILTTRSLKYSIPALSMVGLVASSAIARIDTSCQIETSSGKIISAPGLCEKSGGKKMENDHKKKFWDENNYDPNFVRRNEKGIWMVREGGEFPFKYPDGTVIWPDGRITEVDGMTSKLILGKDNSIIGAQFYRKDGVTPLKPGETIELPSGDIVEQRLIQSH